MLLAFIDETGDQKFKDYLGLCLATIDSSFYAALKDKAQQLLQAIQWDPTVEFKGSYLFSRNKGCSDVEIEARIEAASQLLELNVAKSNRRMKFYYLRLQTTDPKQDYLRFLPSLLKKALPSNPSRKGGKNLLAVMCDERSDVSEDELLAAIEPTASARGFVLLERPTRSRSSFASVGIMFADIVAYLSARIDAISNDHELFEGLTPEQLAENGKIRKLQSSKALISKIRRLQRFVVKG